MQHIPRKRFGQNFLQDQYIINQIIECINPLIGQVILEIGPGLGALTGPLVERVGHLDVVELDRDIIDFLEKNFSAKQLTIHQGDALKFDFSLHPELRVIGNLPYNISTPILFHLEMFSNIKDMTFMLQKEVVNRICAKPNSSDYGRLSIMLQYKFKCRKLLDVPPTAFYPAPKVDSAIVALTPRIDTSWDLVDKVKLNKVVAQAFNQRRKTIANSLKGLISLQTLEQLEIESNLRAENLTVDDYIKLAAII